MPRLPPPPPSARKRTVAAAAITYQLGQATSAFDTFPDFAERRSQTEATVSNALVESSLIHLRALVGFLLADAPGAPAAQSDDARPSWFLGGRSWQPGGKRHQTALYALYNAVSKTAAHTAISTTVHPGGWPVLEGLVVVGRDLRSFLDEIDEDCERQRFVSGRRPLADLLRDIEVLDRPYAPPRANQLVRRARRLLRTQLGWPAAVA